MEGNRRVNRMKDFVKEILATITKTYKERGCSICGSKKDLHLDLESGIVSCGKCAYLHLSKLLESEHNE